MLVQLRDKYLSTHRNGSLEQSALDGIDLHFEHIAGTLGDRFPIQQFPLGGRAGTRGLKGNCASALVRTVCGKAVLNSGQEAAMVYRVPAKPICRGNSPCARAACAAASRMQFSYLPREATRTS